MPAKAPTSFLLSRTAGVKAMGPCRNRPYVPHFCVRLVWPRSAHSRACMLGMATLSDQSVRSHFKCAMLPLRISCAAASAFRRQLAGTVLPRLVRTDYVGYSGSKGSGFDRHHQPVDASVEWPAKHSTVRPSQPWVQCVLSGSTPKSALAGASFVFGGLCSTSSGNSPQPSVCGSIVALAAFAALLVRF